MPSTKVLAGGEEGRDRMAVKWSTRLETGHIRIDNQHKMLINKIVEFKDACESGQPRGDIVRMFLFIDAYVKEHFILEESYMLSKDYPELDKHRKIHRNLEEEYQKLLYLLMKEGEPALLAKTNKFLDEWWKEHVMQADKKMVKFIQKHKP